MGRAGERAKFVMRKLRDEDIRRNQVRGTGDREDGLWIGARDARRGELASRRRGARQKIKFKVAGFRLVGRNDVQEIKIKFKNMNKILRA